MNLRGSRCRHPLRFFYLTYETSSLNGQATYEEVACQLEAALDEQTTLHQDYVPLPIPPGNALNGLGKLRAFRSS